MYGRTYKLYPFSEKNRKALEETMNNCFDSEDDSIIDHGCKIGAIIHEMDMTSDGKVAWLKGADISFAKRVIGIA